MKKNYILFLVSLVTFCINTATAQNVYVYKGTDATPVSTLQNVDKITFGETSVDFLVESGNTTFFALDDLDYFLFYDREQYVGITEIAGNKNARISCVNDVVTIESDENIASANIYTTDGIIIASAKPNANTATLSLAKYSKGIYIIKVEAGGKTITQKLIKK